MDAIELDQHRIVFERGAAGDAHAATSQAAGDDLACQAVGMAFDEPCLDDAADQPALPSA